MQIQTKPQPAKSVISASVPKNISAQERAKLEAGWEQKAKERAEAVERENKAPSEATRVLRFELRQFGRHWNAYVGDGKKWKALLGSPSLLESAVMLLQDAMHDEAYK